MSTRQLRTALSLAGTLAAVACSDGVGPPPPPSISLAPQAQTIQVGEALQLSASVSDPAGNLDQSDVMWSSLEQQTATVTTTGLVTGVRPGSARIIAAAGGVSDTSVIQVARTPATIRIDPVAPIAPGETVELVARVTDTEGGAMSGDVDWSVSDGSIATVSPAGVLTGVRAGVVTVTATASPASQQIVVEVRVPPPPPGCEGSSIQLGVGETRSFDGGSALLLCLSGGAEYLVVAANAGDSARVAAVAAEGVREPGAAQSLLPARTVQTASASVTDPRLDREFERRLRRREREELSPRRARAAVTGRSLQTIPATHAVGDLLQLNTSTSCSEPEPSVGRVQYVGARAIVVADTANPDGFTASDYTRLGMMYDTLLYPVVTEHFGEPALMNGEARAVIYYTRAVNELTEAGSDGVVGGYFWSGDLFPPDVCRGSNEREMFYVLVADPAGTINGNSRSVAYVERVTAGTIAHELQHLINASRRVFLNDADDWEEPWLNEGLSHIAEELVFYDRSGLGPRRNLGPADLGGTQQRLDVTNRYAISNLLRVDRFIRDVERQGPFQGDDDLATRGASWQFLRYALDRNGGDPRVLLSGLVDSRQSGVPNLEGVFGIDAREWFVDEAVSVYADDWASGIAERYRQPSWDFRALFDWISDDGFAILDHELDDGDSLTLRLQGWGTGYLRTAVAAGTVGGVRIGTQAAPAPASLRVVLMRTR